MKSAPPVPSFRSTVAWAATGVALLALGGCNKKSPEKCQDSLKVARQALDSEDFELARKWREYSYTHCEDAGMLATLDKEVVAKEAASRARAQEQQQAKADTDQLLSVLKQFVVSNKSDIAKASAAILCEAPLHPEKENERWCSASRAISAKYALRFRYWDELREAQEFTITPPLAISCSDLGEHTIVATWQVPALDGRSIPRTHCTLTAGELAGFDALVSGAPNAPVVVFSKGYLERDERLRGMATPK